MDEKNYFDVITRSYDLMGFGEYSKLDSWSWKKFISVYLGFPLTVMLNFLVWMNVRYKSDDIFGIVAVFESASTFGQHFLRKITLIVFRRKIDEIIDDSQKFWKIDSFDKEFTDPLYKKLTIALIQWKLFGLVCFSTSSIVIASPLFIKNINLPLACWMPFDNEIFHVFVYFIQFCILYELVVMFIPVDGFFLFMCKNIEIQLQLIGKTLQNLNIGASLTSEHQEECLAKLKQCSSYHNFLLKVHEKVGSIFSIYFLVQFIINVMALTMQFYLLTSDRGSDMLTIFKGISYVSVVTFQDSMSFLPASSVEIEAENLANVIYSVDWYNTPNMKIRKFILFWLMKAQEPVEMSGGGLMKINRNLFLQIPKTSFSIHTLMS